MAIGPRDKIDQLLVKKYAMEKVDNPSLTAFVDSNKMLETISDYAMMQRNMLALNAKLRDVCYGVNAKSATYNVRRKVAQTAQ